MIKNYFKSAFRTLVKNKTFTLVNILGLAIGISFSAMLYVYVSNELSYDDFHSKSDNIYRVLTIDKRNPESRRTYGITVPPMGPALVAGYPEVVDMVRLFQFSGQVVFEIDGEHFQERNWFSTDPNFFNVFDFDFIQGDKTTALKDPFSLVITESTARKYFGDENPLGKTLVLSYIGDVKVTGVIKDMPDNSHLKFNMLFSNIRTDDAWKNLLNDWNSFDAYTYIEIDKNAVIAELKSKMPALQEKHMGQYENKLEVDFQSIKDIYLASDHIEAGTETAHGQVIYVYIFASMGVFLLIIASINYINLATAKALIRSKEVGIRKTIGAFKSQLVTQFLIESFVLTFIALILAIGIMDLVFPYFNLITGKEFNFSIATLQTYLPTLLAISITIGLMSGSYPAFYLATLKPITAIRQNESAGKESFNLRKVLVVFQFVLTIVMIVCTLAIGNQLNFIQTKDIGFNKEQLIVIDINNGNVRQQFQVMKNEFANIPGVSHVGVSSRVPGEWKNITELYVTSNDAPGGNSDSIRAYFMGFDQDMLATYEISLKSGKNFSSNQQVDSTTVLINESAVKTLGLANPLGAAINLRKDGILIQVTIAGVLEDFNFQSLHRKIEPIIIGSWNNPFYPVDYFTLKFNGDPEKVIKEATRVHALFDEQSPIEYHFLNEQMKMFYVAERRVGLLFIIGACLSVLVAGLGLYGLATYYIERRTKELGIRKVLGASGVDLFLLLSSSFTKQVGLAFLIGSPIAYLIMDKWLEAFEYKIILHPGIFILAGLIALAIAMGTISYRSIKAARANPVNSLKQE
ncbi:MAG TPA: ABC transporter permease [Ohtaekwangia sp.]|nr:ABC transporter permease [Ohtaekwangia sp.]